MKKIIIKTKKQKLEEYIAKVVICNTPKKSKHCLTQCAHGRFHTKEVGREACHHPEFCSLGRSEIIKVKCKPLTKKAQKEWVKNELKKIKETK